MKSGRWNIKNFRSLSETVVGGVEVHRLVTHAAWCPGDAGKGCYGWKGPLRGAASDAEADRARHLRDAHGEQLTAEAVSALGGEHNSSD